MIWIKILKNVNAMLTHLAILGRPLARAESVILDYVAPRVSKGK